MPQQSMNEPPKHEICTAFGASCLPASPAQEAAPRLLVFEFEPVDAVRAAVLVVVAAVGAAAVHQHAVQAILVALAAVRVRGQVLSVADVQVQLLVELVPVIDLRSGVMGIKLLYGLQHGVG